MAREYSYKISLEDQTNNLSSSENMTIDTYY